MLDACSCRANIPDNQADGPPTVALAIFPGSSAPEPVLRLVFLRIGPFIIISSN
jgi:hypothetical protein